MSEIDTGTSTSTSTQHSTTRRIPPPPTVQRVPANRPTDTSTHAHQPVGEAPIAVMIRPWIDPVVDESGHDPRSRYVEQFWLGVLGPTATWLLRRLAAGLSEYPDGYMIDLATMAREMGLSYNPARSSPFSKALQRCTMFGLAHQTSDGFAVRRRIPAVANRHLRRMPPAVQRAHASWQDASATPDEFARAHQLALAMLDAGDGVDAIEHQLIAIGVSASTAADVADNAAQL